MTNRRTKTRDNMEKKYVLDSSEFINENVYCKLKTFRWYSLDRFFKYLASTITGYDESRLAYAKEKHGFSFEYEYEKTYKSEFDVFKFYGIKNEFVETPKGDKFVFALDDTHSFVFYPMCSESRGGNESRLDKETNTVTDPKYGVLVVYAVANGKATKIDGEFNHYYLADNNFSSYNPSKELKSILKVVEHYVKTWGFDRLYAEKNTELKGLEDTVYEKMEERENEKRVAAERDAEEKRIRDAIQKNGAEMTVYFKGKPVMRKTMRGGLNSVANVRYAFSLNAKLSLEDAVRRDEHPDTTGMTNLDESPRRKAVYTERNLPKDHYELVKCYRTYAGEVCEHCGKDPIVNVMVIKNPKGETFHVGNECVSHLVDIPEEEFEENWNAPFKEAGNMMTKVRNDKNKGIEGTWYTYNGKCFYVIEKKPMFEYALFGDSYDLGDRLYCGSRYTINEKVLKRDLNYVEKPVSFMKRMLPRWYANSIEIDVNIGDLINMLYDEKHASFTHFTYNGVDYKIPTTDDWHVSYKERPFIIKEVDFAVGEYEQKFEDAGHTFKNTTYRFGNVTIEYKWNTDLKNQDEI